MGENSAKANAAGTNRVGEALAGASLCTEQENTLGGQTRLVW